MSCDLCFKPADALLLDVLNKADTRTAKTKKHLKPTGDTDIYDFNVLFFVFSLLTFKQR